VTDSPSTSGTDVPAAESAAPGRRRRPSGRAWIAIVALAVVGILVGIPVVMTATPAQCAGCHEMKPYYDSWKSSSHVGAASNCLYCHSKPGILGYAEFEASFYGMLAGQLSGAKVRSTSANAPSLQSCGRPECHSLNREVSNAGDIKINHRTHVVKVGIPCTKCHPGAVHTGVGGRLKLPPMTLCKTCHADKMQQCGYCHNEQRLGAPPAGAGH
jgi:hypothetical protein